MKSRKKQIYLQQIGEMDRSILIKLKEDLSMCFRKYNMFIKITPNKIQLEENAFNPNSGQYDASKILDKIIRKVSNDKYFRLLGVLDEDIYTQGLNFVFGVAKMSRYVKSSGSALISVTRLKESFYNRPKKVSLFHLRILKEAVHELGHTFRLKHCNNQCIMRFSNHLGETDNKPVQFCDSCLLKLEEYFY